MASLRMKRASVRFLKKLVSITLAGCLALSGAPVSSFAQEGSPISGGGAPIGGTGMTVAAPGGPVAPASCGDMTDAVNRLQSGLPTIDDAIRRTQKVIEGANEERAEAGIDLTMTALDQSSVAV